MRPNDLNDVNPTQWAVCDGGRTCVIAIDSAPPTLRPAPAQLDWLAIGHECVIVCAPD